jgi:hypothetical protein
MVVHGTGAYLAAIALSKVRRYSNGFVLDKGDSSGSSAGSIRPSPVTLTISSNYCKRHELPIYKYPGGVKAHGPFGCVVLL